jgi:hypothetical protein
MILLKASALKKHPQFHYKDKTKPPILSNSKGMASNE